MDVQAIGAVQNPSSKDAARSIGFGGVLCWYCFVNILNWLLHCVFGLL